MNNLIYFFENTPLEEVTAKLKAYGVEFENIRRSEIMRDIKFRVWDKIRDKMYEDNNISYIDFKENLVCVYDYIDYYEDTRFLFKDDNVIMQYTGLKDKNGKEIYEGDVLDYGEFGKYKVVFSKASFKIQKLYNLNGNLHLLGECFFDEIEVVGNIYEIPEFLK